MTVKIQCWMTTGFSPIGRSKLITGWVDKGVIFDNEEQAIRFAELNYGGMKGLRIVQVDGENK